MTLQAGHVEHLQQSHMGLQTVEEVHRGAEAIAENYKHSKLESREQYDAMYKRSVEDPEGFWSDIAKEFHWKKQVSTYYSCSLLTQCQSYCHHQISIPLAEQSCSMKHSLTCWQHVHATWLCSGSHVLIACTVN